MKTITLETAKKLKEAGWSKETEKVWIEEIPIITPSRVTLKEELILFRFSQTNDMQRLIDHQTYPAPTIDELLDVLPQYINVNPRKIYTFEICMGASGNEWHYIPNYNDTYNNNYLFNFMCRDKNPTEAVAKLYLKLKQEGLV